MKNVIDKQVQSPKPEPTSFGRCRVVSRNPITIPNGATAESFDAKYGFYKYQPKNTFGLTTDIYPILKNDGNSNAIYIQTTNRLHLFVLKSGTLPNQREIQSLTNQLIESSKTKDKTAIAATYSRENYIFLEKTTSGKLLFIDKGETKILNVSINKNSYYYINLPIFVLSSPQFYQYKKESEKVYYLAGQDAFQFDLSQIDNNNNGLFSANEFYSTLPFHIQEQIIAGTCICDTVAYPHYNGGLSSNDLNAPRASFKLRSYSTVAEDAVNTSLIFQEQTGAFQMDKIGEIVRETKGEYYEVEYSFGGDTTVYKIIGKIRIYGYSPSISMERQAQSNAFVSSLPSSWQGVVFRLNESSNVLKEVYQTLDTGGGNSGQPSGCPPA